MHEIKWEKHYDINQENVLMHELIGLKCEVAKSRDENKKGLKGIIIKETKNTLKIKNEHGEKILPKKEIELKITLPNKKKIIFDGKMIIEKPEDRTKQLWRKYYGKMQ